MQCLFNASFHHLFLFLSLHFPFAWTHFITKQTMVNWWTKEHYSIFDFPSVIIIVIGSICVYETFLLMGKFRFSACHEANVNSCFFVLGILNMFKCGIRIKINRFHLKQDFSSSFQNVFNFLLLKVLQFFEFGIWQKGVYFYVNAYILKIHQTFTKDSKSVYFFYAFTWRFPRNSLHCNEHWAAEKKCCHQKLGHIYSFTLDDVPVSLNEYSERERESFLFLKERKVQFSIKRQIVCWKNVMDV